MKKLITQLLCLIPSCLFATNYTLNTANVAQLLSASEALTSAHTTAKQEGNAISASVYQSSLYKNRHGIPGSILKQVDERNAKLQTSDPTPTLKDLSNTHEYSIVELAQNILNNKAEISALTSPAAYNASAVSGYGPHS